MPTRDIIGILIQSVSSFVAYIHIQHCIVSKYRQYQTSLGRLLPNAMEIEFFLCYKFLLCFQIFSIMSKELRRLKSRDLNSSPSNKYRASYYKLASRTSIIKGNFVRFGEDSILTDEEHRSPLKDGFSSTIRDNYIQRPILRNAPLIKSQLETRSSHKDDDVYRNLAKFDAVRLPATIRKIYSETTRVITGLLNAPAPCHSSIMRELKCLMSNSPAHDSYLLTRSVIYRMKERLKELNSAERYTFRYEPVAALIKKIEQRCANSEEMLSAFENLLHAHRYPVSVELMLMYIGVHLHSINSSYERAEEICKRMLDLLLKLRLDEYLTIYLILMVKLKSNLGEWSIVVALISKALAAAWVHKLEDLQIWCYFEFSRAYFALGNTRACGFFKERSEMSITEQPNTIYRVMVEQNYRNEVERMRVHNYYFDLESSITYEQLTDHAEREKSTITLKAQVYAKVIAENFKIKHVKNLISRLGQDVKMRENMHEMAGNPHFMTHQSGIKNLNVYFRVKHKRGDQKKLYTFENSAKNQQILKEMMRNLLIEMKWYVPIIENA